MRFTLLGSWIGWCRWIPRWLAPINIPPGRGISFGGAQSNYTNLWPEPPDHVLGRSRGGFSTKAHAAVDGDGRPLTIRLTGGQAGDNPELMSTFDAETYRRRNVVERAFGRLKQWRAVATRYDKHARNYRAGIVLAAIVMFWLK